MRIPDSRFTNFLLSIMSKKYRGFFIEAGANDGYAGSVCYWLEHALKWTGMNIECSPYCFELLAKNRPKCINVNTAISNKEGKVNLILPMDGPRGKFAGQASISTANQDFGDRPVERHIVNCTTIGIILEEHQIQHIDLLVLDVEGSEAEVIRGMTVYPDICCIEHDKVGSSVLDALMISLDYTKITTYINNSIYKRDYDNT